MGAQSTGKSYLMNRLFDSRFAVASSRTTVGIWISIYRTPEMNYLVLDCEGLFSPNRSLVEEEKLIKIISCISDFTIMNLNKSSMSRNYIELL